MQGLQKQSFVLAAYNCIKNFSVTGMYVVADFYMMFNRGVDIPFVPGLCSAPRDFQFLLLSPTYANEHVLQVTLYTFIYSCEDPNPCFKHETLLYFLLILVKTQTIAFNEN